MHLPMEHLFLSLNLLPSHCNNSFHLLHHAFAIFDSSQRETQSAVSLLCNCMWRSSNYIINFNYKSSNFLSCDISILAEVIRISDIKTNVEFHLQHFNLISLKTRLHSRWTLCLDSVIIYECLWSKSRRNAPDIWYQFANPFVFHALLNSCLEINIERFVADILLIMSWICIINFDVWSLCSVFERYKVTGKKRFSSERNFIAQSCKQGSRKGCITLTLNKNWKNSFFIFLLLATILLEFQCSLNNKKNHNKRIFALSNLRSTRKNRLKL